MSSLRQRPNTRLDVAYISSASGLQKLVELFDLPTQPVSLYFNFEGIKLGADGKMSKMVVFVPPKSTVYVVELRQLGPLVFCVAGANGQTLKTILESDSIPKAFFDVRNAAAALFVQHHIALAAVHDVQLMELATRQGDFNKKFVVGWDKCIKEDGDEDFDTREEAFAPSLPRFNKRILQLPVLWATYHARLTRSGMTFWVYMVREAIKRRVSDAQRLSYDKLEARTALGPWSAGEIEEELDAWNDDVITQAIRGESWVNYDSFNAL